MGGRSVISVGRTSFTGIVGSRRRTLSLDKLVDLFRKRASGRLKTLRDQRSDGIHKKRRLMLEVETVKVIPQSPVVVARGVVVVRTGI